MKYCPQCKTEYRDGFSLCGDCNTELSDTKPIDCDKVDDTKPAGFMAVVMPIIIGGVSLFFLLNIMGMAMMEPLKALTTNIDTKTPINLTLLFGIPMGICAAAAVSIFCFWFLKRDAFLLFSLCSSIIAFLIDGYLKIGGPFRILFLIQDNRGYLIFAMLAFVIDYGTAFIALYCFLRVLNNVFVKQR